MQKPISLFLVGALLITVLPFTLVTSAQEVVPAPQTEQTMTNKDVTELLKSGVSAEVIIAKIKTSPSKFDTSTAALREMKAANIPESVVLAMIQASSPTTPTASRPLTKEVAIDDGTPVEIELLTVTSSEVMKVGDVVDFKVVQPVEFKGVTIIEKNAVAKARVTEARKSGFWGRAGKLEWAMQYVVGIDNSRIPLRFTQRTVGDSKGATVAIGAAATTLLLGPAALLWGLKKGKPVIVSTGNRYYVFVQGTPLVNGHVVAAK